MNHEEIVKEVKMTYYELLDYLLEKYGSAKYDYFTKPECKYKNKKVGQILLFNLFLKTVT